MRLVLEFDGGSAPNGSGCGAVLYQCYASDARLVPVWRAWCYLATTPINNNATEYEGLSCGLWYLESELKRSSIRGNGSGGSSSSDGEAAPAVVLEVRGDSKTCIDHMKARSSWVGVRQPTEPAGKLQQYHDAAWEICTRLTSKHGCQIHFQWQKRDANSAPDGLANFAISSRTDGFERAAERASDGAVVWSACELQRQPSQCAQPDQARKRAREESGEDCGRSALGAPSVVAESASASAAAVTGTSTATATATGSTGSTGSSSGDQEAAAASSATESALGTTTIPCFQPTIAREVRAAMEARRQEALRKRAMTQLTALRAATEEASHQ